MTLANPNESPLKRTAPGPLPTVAVVINSCNDAQWLPFAVESVLSQTHPADEVIVIDDGSDADPSPLIAKYGEVRLVRQANQGLAAARNTGLDLAQADFVLFLDADDRLEPNAIATGLACFESFPGAGFVYGGHRTINGDGSRRD